MSTEIATYDVFLSYSLADGQVAEPVERALMEVGLGISNPKAEPGALAREAIWKALAESDVVVVIVNPQRTLPAAIGLEVGAAMAWHKPVYVVHTEARSLGTAVPLGDFPVYPLSRIDDMVQAIRDGLQPLSMEDRSLLSSVYAELGIPTDKLLGRPALIDDLASAFHKRSGKRVSGERLLQELVRLRKSGNLKRLRS